MDGHTHDKSREAFEDIANALMHLRAAFIKHHMKAPKCIELATRKDGDILRYMLPMDMIYTQPEIGRRDDPDIVMNIVGFEVRYPAQFRARERGGFDIV